jgi:Rieske Fe-S protein
LVNRRRLLGGLVAAVFTAIGASLAVLVGGAVISPGLSTRRESWVDAGTIDRLSASPTEMAIAVAREDGYRTVRDRRIVYLVREGRRVRALSATCTHLGCRVSWREAEREFRCPCHGGRFDGHGAVVGGPPPRGLTELATRVDGSRVLVRLG